MVVARQTDLKVHVEKTNKQEKQENSGSEGVGKGRVE